MQTVIAVSDAWLREPNGPLFVRRGEVWDANDPVVKRHPGNFKKGDPNIRRSVETATAVPGEVRETKRSN